MEGGFGDFDIGPIDWQSPSSEQGGDSVVPSSLGSHGGSVGSAHRRAHFMTTASRASVLGSSVADAPGVRNRDTIVVPSAGGTTPSQHATAATLHPTAAIPATPPSKRTPEVDTPPDTVGAHVFEAHWSTLGVVFDYLTCRDTAAAQAVIDEALQHLKASVSPEPVPAVSLVTETLQTLRDVARSQHAYVKFAFLNPRMSRREREGCVVRLSKTEGLCTHLANDITSTLARGHTPSRPPRPSSGRMLRHDGAASLRSVDGSAFTAAASSPRPGSALLPESVTRNLSDLRAILLTTRRTIVAMKGLVDCFQSMATGELPPDYDELIIAADSAIRAADYPNPHEAARPLLDATASELAAVRHTLAADNLVNKYDMFGALLELHNARNAFERWGGAVSSRMASCRQHHRAKAQRARSEAERSTTTRQKSGFWSSLFTSKKSSSATVAEVAAEWRPPPSKSHWWVQLLSDTVVAKMKVFFARTLPKSASLPRSLPSASPRSPGDWRSDGSSVGSGGGSGAGAGVSLASRGHGEVRNRFNFSGLLEAFVQRCDPDRHRAGSRVSVFLVLDAARLRGPSNFVHPLFGYVCPAEFAGPERVPNGETFVSVAATSPTSTVFSTPRSKRGFKSKGGRPESKRGAASAAPATGGLRLDLLRSPSIRDGAGGNGGLGVDPGRDAGADPPLSGPVTARMTEATVGKAKLRKRPGKSNQAAGKGTAPGAASGKGDVQRPASPVAEEDVPLIGTRAWPVIFSFPTMPDPQLWPAVHAVVGDRAQPMGKTLYHYEAGRDATFFVVKVTPSVTLCTCFKDERRLPQDEDVMHFMTTMWGGLRSMPVFARLRL